MKITTPIKNLFFLKPTQITMVFHLQLSQKMNSYALKKGYSINEYAIKDKKTGVEVKGIKTERDIFKFLGLSYVPPAKRVPDYKFPEV